MSSTLEAPKPQGDFKIPEPGNYQAICYKVVVIGKVWEPFKKTGQMNLVPKIQIYWELPTELRNGREGEPQVPHTVNEMFRKSSSEKSNLYKLIFSWSNGLINQKNIGNFDLKKLLGMQCLLTVVHNPSKTDPTKKFLKMAGVAALPKGMKPLKQINPKTFFDTELFDQEEFNKLSSFTRGKIVESEEFKALKLDPVKVQAIANAKYEPKGDDENVETGFAPEVSDEEAATAGW